MGPHDDWRARNRGTLDKEMESPFCNKSLDASNDSSAPLKPGLKSPGNGYFRPLKRT
jgi:hypothetical protein